MGVAWSEGDIVKSGQHSRGRVVAVDIHDETIEIIWDDGDSGITYPADASYLEKALPWE